MKQLLELNEYDHDFYAWTIEQAQLLREGRFDLIDLENIAEEIESLGKRDHRELRSRLEVLLGHLLKWQYQLARRCPGWRRTIMNQRREIALVLGDSPSLVRLLEDQDWLHDVWKHAKARARQETDLDCFPTNCPWGMQDEVLAHGWLP